MRERRRCQQQLLLHIRQMSDEARKALNILAYAEPNELSEVCELCRTLYLFVYMRIFWENGFDLYIYSIFFDNQKEFFFFLGMKRRNSDNPRPAC